MYEYQDLLRWRTLLLLIIKILVHIFFVQFLTGIDGYEYNEWKFAFNGRGFHASSDWDLWLKFTVLCEIKSDDEKPLFAEIAASAIYVPDDAFVAQTEQLRKFESELHDWVAIIGTASFYKSVIL